MKYLKALFAIVVLVFIDQFTKHLAVLYLKGSSAGRIIIPGVFRLFYLENRGSAFGLMQNQIIFFVIFTIIVLIILTYAYSRLPQTRRMIPLRITLIGIFAGAVGNFIDRITQQYVVDFFYFELIDFPIFNMADIYVTVSAIVLVVLIIFYYKDEDFPHRVKHDNKHDSNRKK